MEKMMKLDEATARKLYPTASPEFKAMLEQSFGEEFFRQDVMDLIKTFEDACSYNGSHPKDERFLIGKPHRMATERMEEVTLAFNGGKVVNLADPSYLKYYNYFEFAQSGFRFHAAGYSRSGTHSPGGSRLGFFHEKHARYCAKQFIGEYEIIFR